MLLTGSTGVVRDGRDWQNLVGDLILPHSWLRAAALGACAGRMRHDRRLTQINFRPGGRG